MEHQLRPLKNIQRKPYFIFFAVISTLLFSTFLCSGAIYTKNIQDAEFGAKGDGNDDALAFFKFSQFLATLNPTDECTLIIPYYQPSPNNNLVANYVCRTQLLIDEAIVKNSTSLAYNAADIYSYENVNAIPQGSISVYSNPRIGTTWKVAKYFNLIDIGPNIHKLTIETDQIDPLLKSKITVKGGQYYGSWIPPNFTYNQYNLNCVSGCAQATPYQGGSFPSNASYIPDCGATNYSTINCQQNCDCHTSSGCSASSYRPCSSISSPQITFTNTSITTPAPVPSGFIIDINDTRLFAMIGNIININNSQNVRITNLELDGNLNSTLIGGPSGSEGIQLPYTGIFILGNNKTIDMNTQLEGINVHHFGMDGITIKGGVIGNSNADKRHEGPRHITLTDCNFDYNARQGLSWICGSELTATNCSFSQTGQGGLSTSPNSGIDIEPDEKRDINWPMDIGEYCIDGQFTDCDFINNVGPGVTNDGYDPNKVKLNNIKFIKCLFHDRNGPAVRVYGEKFKFDDCDFWGTFIGGYRNSNPDYATVIINSRFKDVAYNGNPINLTNNGSFIVSDHANSMLIKNCQFDAMDEGREFLFFNSLNTSIQPMNYWPILEDNNFIYHNKSIPLFGSIVFNAIFRGNNIFEIQSSIPQNCTGRTIQMGDILIEGSNSCDRKGILSEGKINFKISKPIRVGYYFDNLNNLQSDGNAIFSLENGSMLRGNKFVYNTSQVQTNDLLHIGQKGIVDVKESCSFLILNSVIHGELNIHSGAYIHQNGGLLNQFTGLKTITVSQTGNLFISSNCNPGITNYGIDPLYFGTPCNGFTDLSAGSGIGGDWYGPVNGTCVQGGNTAYTPPGCTPITYTNIATSGAFSVMYNLNCYNQLDLKIIGGTPNFTYSISGGPSLPLVLGSNNEASIILQFGINTIVITDANNCSSTFSVETLIQPLSVNLSSTPCPAPLTVTCTGTGGTPPYTYSLDGITYQTSNVFQNLGSGVYTVYVQDALSCVYSTSLSSICAINFSCKLFIEGYYETISSMTPALQNRGCLGSSPIDVDYMTLEIYDLNLNLVYTGISIVDVTGEVNFPNIPGIIPGNYYIQLKSPSSLKTASSSAIPFYGSSVTYDFTNNANKAKGNNMVEVDPGVWAFYSGDVIDDNTIDVFDLFLLQDDMNLGLFGCYITDLNGDGSVDAFDYLILDPNLINGVTADLWF